MPSRKKIFAIIGSASTGSSNLKLVNRISALTSEHFNMTIFEDLGDLPHFNPELPTEKAPQPVLAFRQGVADADGILICTPEYIFSIPSRLKNALEWCVSTTVFSRKPVALITASAGGEKAHEELKLIMRTIETHFTEDTTLLVKGVKGKVSKEGTITDNGLSEDLNRLVDAYKRLVAME